MKNYIVKNASFVALHIYLYRLALIFTFHLQFELS